jgi:ribosomal protein S18 acetylase RimI-like enzyme
MPKLTTAPASTLPHDRLVEIFNEAFADYVIEMQVDCADLSRFILADGVDLSRSIVALDGEKPVGLCMLGYRGRRMRVCSMGVIPSHRGKGAGSLLVREAIAKAPGIDLIQLECILANKGALRLYERLGFTITRTLIGVQGEYNGAAFDPPEPTELNEVDPWGALTRRRIVTPTVPTWQLEPGHPFTGPECRAYELGPSLCVVTLGDEYNHIRVITTDPDHEGKGWASALLCKVMEQHPGKPWRIIAILPEEWGTGLYNRVGMERVTFIEQREMTMRLT